MAHSKYSPSRAHRYMTCLGSVALEEELGAPDKGSKYAQEGTAAHALAEMVFLKEIGNPHDMVGRNVSWQENGNTITYEVTENMASNIEEFTNFVYDRVEEFGKQPGVVRVQLNPEQRVDFSHIVDFPEQGGTADVIIEIEFEDGSMSLSVEDLKYGQGVKEYAEGNQQLMLYGAAAASMYEMCGFEINDVTVAIHQIRLNNFTEETYAYGDICAFADKVKYSVRVAEEMHEDFKKKQDMSKLELKAGEKQCKFCKAKSFCPAHVEEVNNTVGDFSSDFDVIDEPAVQKAVQEVPLKSPQTLAKLFQRLPLIDMWVKAITTAAYDAAHAGEKLPGLKLVEGRRGARQWIDAEEAEETMRKMRLKQDEMYSRKLITPTQAEKLLKDSPRRLSKMQVLVTQSEGKPSLVPEADKRPALDLSPESDFDELDNLA